MTGFFFDAATHTYTLDGVVLPSPSAVFADLGLVDTRFFTADSRARGRAAHAWIAEALAGRSYAGADPEIKLFVESALRIVDRIKPRIVRMETALYHAALGFAGTSDAEWDIGAWSYIVDWKTGKAPKVARYQTAAYEMLARAQAEREDPEKYEIKRPLFKRAAVELQADGSMANLVYYGDHTDGAAWLNLLGTYRIRQALRAGALVAYPQGE